MKWDDIHDRSKAIVRQAIGQMLDEDDTGSADGTGDIVGHLRDSEYLAGELKRRERYDYRRAFRDLKRGERRRRGFRVLAAACGAACIFVAACLLVFTRNGNDRESVVNHTIQAKGMKAVLVKANGDELVLDTRSLRLNEDNGAVLAVDSSGLQYEIAGSPADDSLVYNTLTVPPGGVYQLTLADGTKVWMNSDSRLVYPVAFPGDTREVTLTGEAYFDVRENAAKPFIVATGVGKIKVLGTRFNVKCYPEEASVVTTLVSGSVSFCNNVVPETRLLPGYQLEYGEGGTAADIREVNVNHYVSWRDNQLAFQGETLENIMRMLARWYDVEVVFEDGELKQLEFSGNLDRYEDIGKFFKLFELGADVEFAIDNKVIHVRKKK